MKLRNMQDVKLENKLVILRLDLNVQIENGKITDTFRIDSVIPTISYLIKQKAKIVIISHLGRPNGQKNPALSLSILAPELSKKLGQSVKFIDDCIGKKADNAKLNMKSGEVILLENLRFYKGEETNDTKFARDLAKNADIYIDDAFATSHRAHASTEGITKFLPSYAGFLIQEELKDLSLIFENPEHPLTAIIAGAKVSTKIGVLKNLVKIVDNLIIDGAMGTTFLYAMGYKVGKSMYEPDMKTIALEIFALAKEYNCQIILPVDKTVTKQNKEDAESFNRDIDKIESDDIIQDTGKNSIKNYKKILENTKMLIWCGPVGHSEWAKFLHGTKELAKIIGNLTKQNKLVSIVGGGDTVSALDISGETKNMTYVSTAGGAFLEFIEGKNLPGIKVLEYK